MTKSYFPRWRKKQDGIIAPDERLPLWPTIAMGAQHVVAMFGATVMAPLLMGFDPNVAILMSGLGTLLFFVIVGGRVPSYLGSSFSFIGIVISVTGYLGSGPNMNIGTALGGIIFCGALYALIGLIVMAAGTSWIEKLMPPIVTGSVVSMIGLNLAPIAVKSASGNTFDSSIALFTILCVGAIAVYTRGLLQRLPILLGLFCGYMAYCILGPGIDFSVVFRAPWLGLPNFSTPNFDTKVMPLFAPLALILVAENLGHIKAVAAMTDRNLDRYLGRAFLGDGLATLFSGSFGGTGVTTYAENIGVMAVTKIYSSLVFVMAALMAILLGFSPKFGALIQTIPAPVLSSLSIVVFGLITIAGIRIWLEHKIDFSHNKNLIIAAVTLIIGAGDFTLHLPGFSLGGIATGTFCAIFLNWLLAKNWKKQQTARL